MGKNIGWRPRRGHLVAFALSVLAMAAGSSSAVAGVTSVVVPAARISYSCSSAPPATSLALITATATTDGSDTSSNTSSATGDNLAQSGCELTPLLSTPIYNIEKASLTAKIDNNNVNTPFDDPVVIATSTLDNVSFLGNLLTYTKKNVETTCDYSGTGYPKCENDATYSGLRFAGVDRVIPITTVRKRYSVSNYVVLSVLGEQLCGPATEATFSGTLTINDTPSISGDSKVLTYVPLRLAGELRCFFGLRIVNVDIRDVVQIAVTGLGSDGWLPTSVPQAFKAN